MQNETVEYLKYSLAFIIFLFYYILIEKYILTKLLFYNKIHNKT